MEITTAERKQALTIIELIEAITGVQALIAADVKSPWCPILTSEALGKAYCRLAQSLARAADEQ